MTSNGGSVEPFLGTPKWSGAPQACQTNGCSASVEKASDDIKWGSVEPFLGTPKWSGAPQACRKAPDPEPGEEPGAKRMDVSPVLKAALPSAKESESEWSSLTSVETDDEGESRPMSDHEVSLLKMAQIVGGMTQLA